MPQIVYNAIKTPDGTIMQSVHRHNCVIHVDKITKNEYMVDGGLDYLRRSTNGDEIDLSLHLFIDPFEKIREVFEWGRNYDADMNLLPQTEWVALKELNDDHLDVLCSYGPAGWRRILFIQEKQYRNELENL